MLGAEHLLVDRQRALEERPRRRKVALVLKQDGEVVEARRRIGMLGAEYLLADRQRALEERPRLRIGGQRIVPVYPQVDRRNTALRFTRLRRGPSRRLRPVQRDRAAVPAAKRAGLLKTSSG